MEAKVPDEVVPGVYQHYKGPLYVVLGLARNANEDEERSVIYFGVEPHGKDAPMWNYRKVDGVDGFYTPVNIDGEWRERFTYLYPVNSTKIERPVIKK